jgi:integrase
MAKIRRGTEIERDGRWYGRVRYTLPNGNRKDIWMPAKDKTHAAKLVDEKLAELKLTGETDINTDRVTFTELANKYQERKIIPARYVGERKVAGLRSTKGPLVNLRALKESFGNRRIKGITHSDVESYKLVRLDTPTLHDGQRQIASVNRELELLRAMFRFAIREGWLMRSPFEMGEPLISKADETKRERVLTHDEEKRLLDACLTKDANGRQRRLHLRPFLIAALDTGCRRGELFKLRWPDVDLAARTLTIRAINSKTARPRTIGITPRLYDKLLNLRQAASDDDDLVFGLSCTIKTAWKSMCEEAYIKGLRFHDLRHTAITRMVQTRQPSAVIMKISGHSQHSTFARYVNPNAEAVVSIADALAAFNEKASESQQVTEAIN